MSKMSKSLNYGPLVVVAGIVVAIMAISYLVALVISRLMTGVVGL